MADGALDGESRGEEADNRVGCNTVRSALPDASPVGFADFGTRVDPRSPIFALANGRFLKYSKK